MHWAMPWQEFSTDCKYRKNDISSVHLKTVQQGRRQKVAKLSTDCNIVLAMRGLSCVDEVLQADREAWTPWETGQQDQKTVARVQY